MRAVILAGIFALIAATETLAQDAPSACRVLCAPHFNVEPTLTFSNLFSRPRVINEGGTVVREDRRLDFEIILAMGMPTRASWLKFTVEGIFLPFDRDSTPELEFETNIVWLPAERTRGWLSSHVDVVDKFSEAERPGDRRAYTHKLNLELDTSAAVFTWLPAGRWLRGVEVEGSLDYVATGLARAGDVVDGVRFVDKASPWSFSLVFVVPLAPL